jgi:hypothetical protein
MGQVYSLLQFQKNYYNIYLEDNEGNILCIKWPESLGQLLNIIDENYNYQPSSNILYVDDGMRDEKEKVIVNSEQAYQALVPKHKSFQSCNLNIFYVYIDIPAKQLGV